MDQCSVCATARSLNAVKLSESFCKRCKNTSDSPNLPPQIRALPINLHFFSSDVAFTSCRDLRTTSERVVQPELARQRMIGEKSSADEKWSRRGAVMRRSFRGGKNDFLQSRNAFLELDQTGLNGTMGSQPGRGSGGGITGMAELAHLHQGPDTMTSMTIHSIWLNQGGQSMLLPTLVDAYKWCLCNWTSLNCISQSRPEKVRE